MERDASQTLADRPKTGTVSFRRAELLSRPTKPFSRTGPKSISG